MNHRQIIELGKATYEYNAGGRLEKMKGHAGTVTANHYDALGKKAWVSDPDLGMWHYQYDPFGRIVRQIDAKGQYSTMEYDTAGRPTRRALGDVSTTRSHDTANYGLGKIASITNYNGYKEDFYYDLYGRTIGDAIQIDQEQFISTSDFDDYGRATKAVYPNSFAVQNAYDSNGFFIGVSNSASGQPYWTAKDIDALGRVTEERDLATV